MGFRDLVNKFTSGELDPTFLAEVDFDGYRKAARKLRNVVITPQGVAQRRFGTVYENNIDVDDRDKARLIGYDFSDDETYWIVIRENAANVMFDIYLADVLVASVPSAAYTSAQIRDIRWVNDFDRILLLHKDVAPRELRRTTAAMWAINTIVFQFKPTYDFTYQDDPATLPTPNTPYWTAGVTLTPNATAATTVTGSIAMFTSNHVGGLIYGNSGVFRITSVNGAGTIATGYCLTDFADTTAIKGDLAAVFEVAWTDGTVVGSAPVGLNRGWPSHGRFYQSRLVLGGSTALPGTAFASVVKGFSDFDDSDSDDSTGWGVELGVTGNDTITDILAAKSLILLGNRGPASTSILVDTATVPTNAFVNTQGTEAARNIDGVMLDNQVIYPDRAGNTIWSMSYEVPDTGYNVQNASILSSHLIRNPRWGAIYDPATIDGRYLLMVNDDGTMAIYNTVQDENIRAWTLAQTVGSFIDVATAVNEAKVLVRRKIMIPSNMGDTPSVDYRVDKTFNAFRNVTATIDGASNTIIYPTDESYILIGNEIQFTNLTFTFNFAASDDLGLTFEFLNNLGTWESFLPTDMTTGFTTDGVVMWDISDVSNWMAQPIPRTTQTYGEYPDYYWIRIRRNNDNTIPMIDLQTVVTDTKNVIYMERISFDEYMDCVVESASDAGGIVSGLLPLAGQKAFLFANGFPLNDYTISAAGMSEIEVNDAIIKAGIQCPPIIIPMPIVAFMQNGASVYEPSHVDYIYVDYYNTLGLIVDGFTTQQVIPGEYLSDETPQLQSGFMKISPFKGWNPRAEFVISQSYPAPFILRAVSYTIEVNP